MQQQNKKQLVISFRQWSNKNYGVFNSLHKTIKICTLALAYCIVAQPRAAQAQDSITDENKVVELDEVVVQGTPISQQVIETGRQITIITSKQIEQLPATSIDELLRLVPGLETQSRNAFGVQTDFSLRGSTFQQVLVLIDGLRINDPMTAHFNSNIPVAPSEIEQIEIIHGPAAAEFGPDATGGVINIITKTFSRKINTPKLNTTGQALYGENKLISTKMGMYSESEKFKFSLGALNNQSEGQKNNTLAPTRFNINTISASAGYKINPKWNVALRSAFDYRDFAAQYFYSFSKADSATENVNRYWSQARVSRTSENSSSRIDASYINTFDKYVFNPAMLAIKPFENTMQLLNINAAHTIFTNNGYSFTLGLQTNQRHIESNNRGNHKILHIGAYSSAHLKLIEKLSLNLTLRYDYDEQYKASFLPQLNIAYKLTKVLNIRAAAGRSVRVPDFTELYYQRYGLDAGKTRGAGQKIGNPYLKAESSWSAETGFDYNIVNGIKLSSTAFYRLSDNLIDYVNYNTGTSTIPAFLATNTNYLLAQNIAKVQTKGISSELDINYILFNTVKFNYNVNYTLQNSKNENGVISFYIANHAQQQLNNVANIGIGPIRLFISSKYVVRDKHRATEISSTNKNLLISKDYWVWDTQLEGALIPNKLFATIQVNNIFDKQYMAILGPTMPTRWIMGGFRFNF